MRHLRFRSILLHNGHPTCHSTCPLPHRILLSKRTSRLYESCPGLLATQHARCHKEYYSPRGQAVSTSHVRLSIVRVRAPILREQSDFVFLEVNSGQEMRLFDEFSIFFASPTATLIPPKLIENKFSGTSRVDSQIRH